MTDQDIKERAEYILLFAYEKANSVNCYGYIPNKCNSVEYQKAKKRALRMTLNTEYAKVHEYIKNNF